MGVVPRGQGTTQNDVIECDPELPMETEIDNTSANNPSQSPVADPSGEAGLVELGCSKLEPIGANSSSSVHQVELQSRGLTQNVAHRQLPVYHGAYVDGFVQGVDATLTVDTGAVNSIVSHRLFKKISKGHCPKLTKAAQVDAAGGKPLKTYGKAVVEICMGPLCFEHECTVSDIVDEFLLGEDLMLCDPSGPADIIQSEERMVFWGVSIPLKLVKPPTIRRATIAESVEVPPMEEVIVDAYLDREEHVNAEEERHLLVEMHPNLPEGYGCLLAPTVVDAANSTTIPVHIFNPHSNPIVIRQDSVVGQVETVKVQQTIAEHENPNEVGNDSAVRRVTLQETGGLKGNTHMSRCQAKFHRKSITRKTAIQAPTVPLPDHLKGLYEESIKGKSKVQQVQVHSLLQKHEEVFSKDKYDLGHTHLVEHTIDTGDAKPIKQPPR